MDFGALGLWLLKNNTPANGTRSAPQTAFAIKAKFAGNRNH